LGWPHSRQMGVFSLRARARRVRESDFCFILIIKPCRFL
jgi:hypothetical protein